MCLLPKHGVIFDIYVRFQGFLAPSSRGSVASNGIQTRTPTTWKWPPRLGDRCEILPSPPFPEKHPGLADKISTMNFQMCFCFLYWKWGIFFTLPCFFFGVWIWWLFHFGEMFFRFVADVQVFQWLQSQRDWYLKEWRKILARIFQVTVSTFGRGKKRPNKKTNV